MNALIETLRDILATPLRSLLTVIGIVIGIAAVIIVMAIGEGNRVTIQDKIKSLGTNLMAINLSGATLGGGFGPTGPHFIDESRLNGLISAIPAVAAVSPVINISGQARYKNRQRPIDISAVYASYPQVRNLQLVTGRFFNTLEHDKARTVAVVSESTAKELGVGKPDVGRAIISINDQSYQVIGITKDLPSFDSAVSQKQIFLPYRHIMNEFPRIMLTDAFVKVDEQADVDSISEIIRKYLVRYYGEESRTWLKGMTDMLNAEKAISDQTTLVIVGIASLSLLVGGIGIMNIMLVTIKEKTREIGLRKALGAKERDILLQFIGEGVVLCVIGGVIGTLLGVLISLIAAIGMDIPVIISYQAIIIAILFSTLVGLFFSIYPAMEASKLSPVEALRYE